MRNVSLVIETALTMTYVTRDRLSVQVGIWPSRAQVALDLSIVIVSAYLWWTLKWLGWRYERWGTSLLLILWVYRIAGTLALYFAWHGATMNFYPGSGHTSGRFTSSSWLHCFSLFLVLEHWDFLLLTCEFDLCGRDGEKLLIWSCVSDLVFFDWSAEIVRIPPYLIRLFLLKVLVQLIWRLHQEVGITSSVCIFVLVLGWQDGWWS